MAVFRTPGLADEDAPQNIVDEWNARIVDEVSRRPASPFLVLDPADIADGEISSAVKWPAHPLEPLDCMGETIAEQLSDWGWLGRAELHNEYLEYRIVLRPDSDGNMRPKRFLATTELKEWWMTMAVHDVDFFLSRVKDVTSIEFTSDELFGISRAAWNALSVERRETLFDTAIVGRFGNAPTHSLNQDHVLFMAHPINGLDDLIYVVHFGSFPYAVNEEGSRRRARIEEVFDHFNVEYLFCRNADPGAAAGAYGQVFLDRPGTPEGKAIAFADPLGMYIRTFSSGDLRHNGDPVPESWTRWSRGHDNDTPQRLEFGPSDDEPYFLDEVTDGGGDEAPKINGFQLAKKIEVGPLVMIDNNAREIRENEFQEINASPPGSITCGLEDNDRCAQIAAFYDLFQSQTGMVRGTRGGRNA